jgi:hypothetical protein
MVLTRPQRSARRLYMLGFDHRSSFSRDLLGNRVAGDLDRSAAAARIGRNDRQLIAVYEARG